VEKADFTRGKRVVSVEWWLDECAFPSLVWARLRVYSDGSADACWDEGTTLYGFTSRQFASYFLSEDEYTRLDTLDDDDAREFGLALSAIVPPVWSDPEEQPFEYLGTY
jgi:hypothetical protein